MPRAAPGSRLRPSRSLSASSSRRLAAIALALAALFAGCGESQPEQEAAGQLGPDLGTPVRLADCQDWKDGDTSERLGTIREIHAFAGGPVVGEGVDAEAPTLEDEEAYELFENWCAKEFAAGFKLYKLYTRAAAFSGAR